MIERLKEKVIRAGINYVNVLDGRHTSPFTPKEFLDCLESQLKRLRSAMFDVKHEMCMDVAPASLAATSIPEPNTGIIRTPWCHLREGHDGPHICGELRWKNTTATLEKKMKLGIKCQQCGCDEFEKQPVFNDWYCAECERSVGEVTERMKADKAVIDAAFKWWYHNNTAGDSWDFAKDEMDLGEAIESHPDYKEELEGE